MHIRIIFVDFFVDENRKSYNFGPEKSPTIFTFGFESVTFNQEVLKQIL